MFNASPFSIVKQYTPEYKYKTTYYISFNFSIENNDDDGYAYKPVLALEELEYILKHEDPSSILKRFEVVECETEEYEDEPDWDMLPGGHDHE